MSDAYTEEIHKRLCNIIFFVSWANFSLRSRNCLLDGFEEKSVRGNRARGNVKLRAWAESIMEHPTSLSLLLFDDCYTLVRFGGSEKSRF